MGAGDEDLALVRKVRTGNDFAEQKKKSKEFLLLLRMAFTGMRGALSRVVSRLFVCGCVSVFFKYGGKILANAISVVMLASIISNNIITDWLY